MSSHSRRLCALSLSVALVACGTSAAPAPSPPPPAAPPPALPPAPPTGSGAAGAGSAGAALLAIVRAAHQHKMRMTIDMTRADAPDRTSHMVLESVPPDRRHSVMDMATAARTIHVETITVGDRGWMKMGDTPWRATPQPSMAVGSAAAGDMIDQMTTDIESGRVQVTEDARVGGMRVFHATVPDGVLPAGGSWDGRLFVGANDLPDHLDGTFTGGTHGGSAVHQTFAYDDSIVIEPPLE